MIVINLINKNKIKALSAQASLVWLALCVILQWSSNVHCVDSENMSASLIPLGLTATTKGLHYKTEKWLEKLKLKNMSGMIVCCHVVPIYCEHAHSFRLLQLYSESKGRKENFNMHSRGLARWNWLSAHLPDCIWTNRNLENTFGWLCIHKIDTCERFVSSTTRVSVY